MSDPHFDQVALLLHCDGADGSTTFIDSGPNNVTVTAAGGAQISTAQSKWGGSSLYFNGANDKASLADLALGTNDCTIELWLNTSSAVQYAQIIGNEASGYTGFTLLVNHNTSSDGHIVLYVNATKILHATAVDWSDGAWHHVALTRAGTLFTLWVDGVSRATGNTGMSLSSSGNMVIGRNDLYLPRDLVGYIDDLRITKGLARYTANFTPPDAAFPDVGPPSTAEARAVWLKTSVLSPALNPRTAAPTTGHLRWRGWAPAEARAVWLKASALSPSAITEEPPPIEQIVPHGARPPVTLYLAEIEYHDPSESWINRVYWSQDYTQDTVWVKFRGGDNALWANAAPAPDDTVTAATLILSQEGSRAQKFIAEAGQSYTYSLHVKLHTADKNIVIGVFSQYLASNGEMLWHVWPLDEDQRNTLNASSWTRMFITFTYATRTLVWLALPYAIRDSGNDGKSVHVWGAQLNTGSQMVAYWRTLGAVTHILRVATHAYTSHADDDPPLTPYTPRLMQPGLLRRELPALTGGRPDNAGVTTTSYGLVELLHDGDLDAWADMSFDGWRYTLKQVVVGASLASAVTVLRATLAGAELTRTRLTLQLKDRLKTLDTPLSKHTYLGDNSLLEGDAALKDKRKPIAMSRGRNVTPTLVNAARLIYQVHDGALLTEYGETSIAVYDGGYALTKGPNYTSVAELESTAPASGQFRCYPPLGVFRIWGNPQAALTASVSVGLAEPFAATTTAGELLKQLALHAGWPAADIVAADVEALDAAPHQYQPLYYVDDNSSVLDVMNRISIGIGAWFGVDALGRMRMGLLEPPTGDPVATFTEAELISLERSALPTPAKTVTVRYDKNETVIKDPLESVSVGHRAWLANEWRQVIEERPAVAIAYPSAWTVQIDHYDTSREQSMALANRFADLYMPGRALFTARVGASGERLAAIDLNSVVSVQSDRFGLSSGRLLRVVAIQPDLRLSRLDLTLWG